MNHTVEANNNYDNKSVKLEYEDENTCPICKAKIYPVFISASLNTNKTASVFNYCRSCRESFITQYEVTRSINRVSIGDSWSSKYIQSAITIELNAFVEIELRRRVDYTDIWEYIYEMMIYMQLFCPGKFIIDKIIAEVEGENYELYVPLHYPEYKERRDYSTTIGLLDFLKICYLKIPYRKGKNDIRNIPYIVMNTYRSIEDNFLMLYRFVECFYKRNAITKLFIAQCFNEHLHNVQEFTDNQIKHYTQEIISLRNHYVHSGYYIKNSCLKIKFGKNEKGAQNYTAKVDVNWIYERTRLLYSMVIDIIFKAMLGVEEYNYRGNYYTF